MTLQRAPRAALGSLEIVPAVSSSRSWVVPSALLGLGLLWSAALFGLIPRSVAAGCSALGTAAVLAGGLDRGWIDRGIARRLVTLGSPVILAMLSQTVVNLVDTAFVGRLPAETALPGVAALGVALPVFWLVAGFLSAIAIGTQAIVARRHGQADDAAAGSALCSAAVLALGLGVVFSIVGYLSLPFILPFFNSEPAVLEQGLVFARIRYVGIVSMVITAAYKAFFDGTGRTHVHMTAALVMNLVNVVLCYGLVFGALGLPRLEVAGAAWASTIASGVGALWIVGWSLRPAVRRRYRPYRPGALDWREVGAIARLSWPSGAATLIATCGFLFFHKAVAAVDAASGTGLPVNASATAVIQQILLLVFLFAFAFGTATATLVSQSLGAGDAQLAARYTWESVKLASLAMAGWSSVLFLYPEAALSVFLDAGELGATGAREAIAAGVTPLRLIAAVSTFLVAAIVLTQSLYGAGSTRFVMVVEGVLHLTCLVPLAWILGVVLDGGLIGVWCAMGIYVLLLAGIMALEFARGQWREIRL